jgi:hypothetical protein
MGIKETREALSALKGILADAVEAKADGEVSGFEMAKIALSNAPASVSAVMGLDQAFDEIKDIDKDEAKEVAQLALDIGKLVMQLFAKAA